MTNIVSILAEEPFYYYNGSKIYLREKVCSSDGLHRYQSSDGRDLTLTGYLNIKLNKSEDYPLLLSVLEKYKLEIVERNKFMPLWYTLRTTGVMSANALNIANEIFESGKFASSSPEFYGDFNDISLDPYILQQWGLYNTYHEGIDISISKAWNYATGRGVKVAVVDTGFDITHNDLTPNIHLCYDAQMGADTCFYFNHGTHCAGIVAAVRNNDLHIAGVAPDAKLMCASFGNDTTAISARIADCINWSWRNGADIISFSQSPLQNSMISEAIDSAMLRGRNGLGCIFVTSAGNKNTSITFPGNDNCNIITVANIESNGQRHWDSCYGQNMFVSAPGTNIISTWPGNTIEVCTGTSMAAPHVAGVVAMMLERNHSLSNSQVREIIATTTKKTGSNPYINDDNHNYGTWNQYQGYGLINAYEAILHTPLPSSN